MTGTATVTRFVDCCTGQVRCPNFPGNGWYHPRQPGCIGAPITAPITTAAPVVQLELELT